MDANWDLRNYHYYNAWAFLTDRYGQDIAAAQIPSFYNPLLDVPYFLLTQWLPARAVAFLLGMVHGGNLILLTLLGERLLAGLTPGRRLGLAAVAAAVGSCGAMALSEVGAVFYDNVLSLGVFASLLLVVGGWPRLLASGLGPALAGAALAGLPVGLAFGLKQTTVVYPLGLCVALLLTLPAPVGRRFGVAFAFGLGVLAGLAAGGGFWMGHLWRLTGNPLFPYFNQLFRSPWGLAEAYRDTQYLDGPLWRRLIYPLLFSFDSREASEIVFRDFRILAAFLLLPATAVAAGLGRRREEGFGPAPPTVFVLVAAALSYAVWLEMFATYRYITAMEMLAPLLTVLCWGLLPGRRRWRMAAALALLALLAVTTRPGDWIRVPFTARAVEVVRPDINDPAQTLLLLAGHEPLSFLLPAFPPELRILRIDSTFTNPEQTQVLFNPLMARIIAGHGGPLLALFIPIERHDVVKRLGNLHLRLLAEECAPVTSPIGPQPYALCPVVKSPD